MTGETIDLRDVVLTVTVLMTLADGGVEDDEITRIRWVIRDLEPPEVTDDELRSIIERVRGGELRVEPYLAKLVSQLSESDKRAVLKAAYFVATADGRVEVAEDELLASIGRVLGIPAAIYRTILNDLVLTQNL